MRFRNSLVVSCVVLAVAFAPARGADREVALQQALGSQDALYKFTPGALSAAVKVCASNDPEHAGEYVALILHSGRTDADAIAPALVRAAIEGLGENPKAEEVGAIVRQAVTAAPSEVLDIVTAAVKAAPRGAATAIVQAAVRSVPHPEDIVTVNVESRAERIAEREGSDKQADGKETEGKETDGKALGTTEKQLTLAEGIVQAAMDADPGLSVDDLTAATDVGLTTGGGTQPPYLTTVLPPVTPVIPTSPGVVSP